MHAKKEDLPKAIDIPGMTFRVLGGQGNMVMSYSEIPAGPVDSVLEGLPNNCCHCPHWGYLLKGQMTIKYENGEQEVIKAGDLYYVPAGHTGTIDEETIAVEFSPEKEYMEVMDHIKKKLQAMT